MITQQDKIYQHSRQWGLHVRVRRGGMQDPSFHNSIEVSQQLIEKIEATTIRSDLAAQQISDLLSDMVTARGFFVSLLSGEWTFNNKIPQLIVDSIRTSPGNAYTLLARNLVMSSATAVAYVRSDKRELAQGSDRVAERSQLLIAELNNKEMHKELADMLLAVKNRMKGLTVSNNDNVASYSAFLERWSYDSEQIHAVEQKLESVIDLLTSTLKQ
ncbi:MAG: hypothetical protein K2X93_28155 [Candidatus Obscuribacterales bacterium]|nr:hypothetical protein [Candidatus Obscuribacterales bacterium]